MSNDARPNILLIVTDQHRFDALGSVNPKVASPKGAPPVLNILEKALPVDWDYLVKNREKLLKRFSKTMLE